MAENGYYEAIPLDELHTMYRKGKLKYIDYMCEVKRRQKGQKPMFTRFVQIPCIDTSTYHVYEW